MKMLQSISKTIAAVVNKNKYKNAIFIIPKNYHPSTHSKLELVPLSAIASEKIGSRTKRRIAVGECYMLVKKESPQLDPYDTLNCRSIISSLSKLGVSIQTTKQEQQAKQQFLETRLRKLDSNMLKRLKIKVDNFEMVQQSTYNIHCFFLEIIAILTSHQVKDTY